VIHAFNADRGDGRPSMLDRSTRRSELPMVVPKRAGTAEQ